MKCVKRQLNADRCTGQGVKCVFSACHVGMQAPARFLSHVHRLSPSLSHPGLWHRASLAGNHMLMTLHEYSSADDQLYEITRSLKKKEIAYMVDASGAVNVNCVRCDEDMCKHCCGRQAPCDSPIRCRRVRGHSCS